MGPNVLDLALGTIGLRIALEVADEYRRLFSLLEKADLKVMALAKLEGHSNEEIARSLDCSLATVERKLKRIRYLWSRETT